MNRQLLHIKHKYIKSLNNTIRQGHEHLKVIILYNYQASKLLRGVLRFVTKSVNAQNNQS
jgi:hypothetical protein